MVCHNLEIENQKIYQLGRDEAYRGMGTTLEALAIIENQAILCPYSVIRVSV